MTDNGRPQDEGRRHRRKGAPSAATRALLGAYQGAMRDELRDTLAELRPAPTTNVLGETTTMRPALVDRLRLWDLAIKLGRELGTEIDPGPSPSDVARTGPSRPRAGRGRVDYG